MFRTPRRNRLPPPVRPAPLRRSSDINVTPLIDVLLVLPFQRFFNRQTNDGHDQTIAKLVLPPDTVHGRDAADKHALGPAVPNWQRDGGFLPCQTNRLLE